MLRVPFPIADDGEAPPAIAPTVAETDQLAWAKCADEGGTYAVPDAAQGPALVRQGIAGVWTASRSVSAQIACTNAVFGDPVPRTVRSCRFARAGGTTPTDPAVAGLRRPGPAMDLPERR